MSKSDKTKKLIESEFRRISAYLEPDPEPSCKNPGCDNHGKGVHSRPEGYQLFGESDAGSKRYRCKACKKTFTEKRRATLRQRYPEKNRKIFQKLIEGVPFRQICRELDANPKTLYDKIAFIHRQCLVFVASREQELRDQGLTKKISLQTECHEISFAGIAKKESAMLCITIEVHSGYVLAATLHKGGVAQEDIASQSHMRLVNNLLGIEGMDLKALVRSRNSKQQKCRHFYELLRNVISPSEQLEPESANIISSYKPDITSALTDICRVYHNFSGKNKETPAMKLGLSRGKARNILAD